MTEHATSYCFIPINDREQPYTKEQYRARLDASSEMVGTAPRDDEHVNLVYEHYHRMCDEHNCTSFEIKKVTHNVGRAQEVFENAVLPKYPKAVLL